MAPTDDLGIMVPFLLFSYVAGAMGFYRYIYHTAPIMEEESTGCKVYELFPAEEIRRAA